MTKRKTSYYKQKRAKWRLRIFCGALATIMALLVMTVPVSAFSVEEEAFAASEAAAAAASTAGARSTSKIDYRLPGVSNKSIYAHTRMSAIVNGATLSEPALKINGITYLPLRAATTALGAGSVSYNSASRTMTVSGRGLYLSATDGGYVTYANDRPLFSFSPNVVMSNGRMYIPASAFAKATGTRFELRGSAVYLDGTFSPLASAKRFYRDDEVLWLARIISAEAKGESLLGQIAVGDVILNRVKSPLYPNTIYGVIFDRRYGIQFSPVGNGTIYNTPSYTATLAAKICLEGTSLSDNALFFVNPVKAPGSWISRSREYAYTIGNHDFYL
ncbi:MAG: cell wall hydrolase [Clostridia bacterium]|nr:cell wall hydrolase [Clostridia bacterium]